MEDIERKQIILRVIIAICVAALFFAVAYFALQKRQVKPSAEAKPQFEIPDEELLNISAAEEKMQTLQSSAQVAQAEKEKADLKKEGEKAAKQITGIQEEIDKRIPADIPGGTIQDIPGGAFDFNPR